MYFHLCTSINRRSRFIQNQHWRETKHDSCNTKKLLLPLGKTRIFIGYNGIITVRKPFDKTVRMAGFRRPDNLFFRSVRSAHRNIFANCSAPEPCFLQDHSIGFPKTASGRVHDRDTVNLNSSAVHVIETHQQVDDRCLSASGRSYNGNSLPGLRMQVQMLNQFLFRAV